MSPLEKGTGETRKEETMKTTLKILAIGLAVVLSVSAVSAGERERRGDGIHDKAEQYESRIYGTVQRIPKGLLGTWEVNGREIAVTDATLIREKHGKAEEGAFVEVHGTYRGKTFAASSIEVKKDRNEPREFYGTVERLAKDNDGAWIVDGKTVRVTRDTRIREKHGKAEVGAYVKVEGSYAGSTFSAREIEVKKPKEKDEKLRNTADRSR